MDIQTYEPPESGCSAVIYLCTGAGEQLSFIIKDYEIPDENDITILADEVWETFCQEDRRIRREYGYNLTITSAQITKQDVVTRIDEEEQIEEIEVFENTHHIHYNATTASLQDYIDYEKIETEQENRSMRFPSEARLSPDDIVAIKEEGQALMEEGYRFYKLSDDTVIAAKNDSGIFKEIESEETRTIFAEDRVAQETLIRAEEKKQSTLTVIATEGDGKPRHFERIADEALPQPTHKSPSQRLQ